MIESIIFFIGYGLLLFDVIFTEITIFKYKVEELNPLLRIHPIRWTLSILLKVILPIHCYTKFTIPFFVMLLGMIYIVYYGVYAIWNVRQLYILYKA